VHSSKWSENLETDAVTMRNGRYASRAKLMNFCLYFLRGSTTKAPVSIIVLEVPLPGTRTSQCCSWFIRAQAQLNRTSDGEPTRRFVVAASCSGEGCSEKSREAVEQAQSAPRKASPTT